MPTTSLADAFEDRSGNGNRERSDRAADRVAIRACFPLAASFPTRRRRRGAGSNCDRCGGDEAVSVRGLGRIESS